MVLTPGRPARVLALALLVFALAPSVHAQISFAPVVGYDDRGQAPMLGLALEAGAPLYGAPLRPSVRGLVEYVFTDEDLDVIHGTLDLIGRFGGGYGSAFTPYAKGGLAITSVDDRFNDADIEVSANVGGGLDASRFFAEGEYAFGDYGGLRARVGYRF